MTPGTGRCPAGADLYARFRETVDEYGTGIIRTQFRPRCHKIRAPSTESLPVSQQDEACRILVVVLTAL